MNKTLFPIILIVITLGLFFWQINPQYKKMSSLRAQSAQYDDALDTAQKLKDLQGELAKKYDSFSKTDLARLETFLPDHLDTVRIILDVNGIASKYGIVPRDMAASDAPATTAVNQKPYDTASLSFSFTAPYLDIVDFMKDLERSLRLVDVKSIEITPSSSDKDTSGVGYDVKMTINTYWLVKK